MLRYKIKTEDCLIRLNMRLPWGNRVDVQELDRFERAGFRGCFRIEQKKKRSLRYSGPLGKSLTVYLEEEVAKSDFLLLVLQLVLVVQSVSTAGFDTDKLALALDCIFINQNTKEIQVMYLPTMQKVGESVGLKQCIRELIVRVKPRMDQDRDYLSRLNLFLNEMTGFDSLTFIRWVQTEDAAVVQRARRSIGAVSGFMTDKQRDYYRHMEAKYGADCLDEVTGLLTNDSWGDPAMTGLLETELTGLLWSDQSVDCDETGLLSDENMVNMQTEYVNQTVRDVLPILVRVSTGEEIEIEKPVFRIGKERSYVDYFVSDNAAVSRSHADILVRGGQCFVKDLNSKNGTKVNGQLITVHTEIPLLVGDHLCLGNEEFIRRV
ncbi:MAG: FHA domain-containing protein [Lachnospiraceae bacterium]|nr:FHA domain-containing protein [Lachnospiraceae bacterium]MDY5742944.1 FHA domain-containing protein [Lachnospiraceae bacterium]